MKNDDKSILDLLKAYAAAERKIQSAANNRRLTVKQYQRNLNKVVTDALSVLDKHNRKFADRDLQTGFSEGQKKTDGYTPQEHGGMSAGQAASVLSRAGFRYDPRTFGGDTYVELHSATRAAGNGFIDRVSKAINKLAKEGKDTIYNVTQAVKEDIQKQGLLNIEYKGGRKVSVSSYAAMAARSARMESANIGAFGRALENGTDYVRCTTIWPTCEICAKYQGKIYCISGKDKRFPALFETALRSGYALMHPNCRHEFIPVWLELMDEKELAAEIERSKISPKADTRSQKERNAYAEWQAEHRQRYNEQQYFEQAKQVLGPAMPYKDIAAFRRSYRSKDGSFAHQRSHNLVRDYRDYLQIKQILKRRENLPKTLANFQNLRYNDSAKYYSLLVAKAIQEGRQPILVEDGKQGKHLVVHNNYKAGRSYFERGTTVEQIQKAVDRYAGSGRIEMRKNGKPGNKETVRIPELTGYAVDQNTKETSATHIFKIHYSDKGVHIVPKKEKGDDI